MVLQLSPREFQCVPHWEILSRAEPKNLAKAVVGLVYRPVHFAAPPDHPLFFYHAEKKKREGAVQYTSQESNPEKTPPPKDWGHSCKTKRSTPIFKKQKAYCRREKPTSWVAILFSTYTPCGGIIPCPVSTPCGGKKANPNLGCPPPGDATQPAPEPHPPPHHRDAHPAPHPKQESKP